MPGLADDKGEQDADNARRTAVVRKLNKRFIPLFFVLGIVCYLDRTSLSYAALQLNQDLHFSCTVYGLGAAFFFISYALFQVPSNLVCAKLGPPTWLAIIIVAWGCTAASFAFVNGRTMFLLLRFVLGAAECGAFPGMWYSLSLFYPEQHFASAYTRVATSTALAQVIGGPIAAGILHMDGVLGLRGWRWLFILEGVPTIIMGITLKTCLPEGPSSAKFLQPEERAWLAQDLNTSKARVQVHAGSHVSSTRVALRVMRDWRIWYLGFVWCLIEMAVYGLVFWMPLIISSIFSSDADRAAAARSGACAAEKVSNEDSTRHAAFIALVSSIPFCVAAVSMVVNARLSELADERKRHASAPIAIGAVALGLVPVLMTHAGPIPAFIALVIAAGGAYGVHGPIMAWPALFLTGPDAAAGFAMLNSLGAWGGLFGNVLIGILVDRQGGYGGAMSLLAGLLAISAIMLFYFPGPSTRACMEGAAKLASGDDDAQRLKDIEIQPMLTNSSGEPHSYSEEHINAAAQDSKETDGRDRGMRETPNSDGETHHIESQPMLTERQARERSDQHL